MYRSSGSNRPDCNWEANGYRLPTEAEWEKAARGGLSGKRFPWGDTINHTYANYYNGNYFYESPQNQGLHPTCGGNGIPYTSPVGSFAPNGYGLYDTAGNAWELCEDWYSSSKSDRVLRGGSCYDDERVGLRSAFRVNVDQSLQSRDYGFRVVLVGGGG